MGKIRGMAKNLVLPAFFFGKQELGGDAIGGLWKQNTHWILRRSFSRR
ncbi:hypothetical protein CHK_3113 [Christensenella hongkongensis]|uniref:Uncharacterized protein n=1 Tax=Christensenella hongkongensis TaxID=270498 RepID=A0A0M2NGY3_9FIRM|nr:hypothetical protein CHK_3113 [Christensenella hongkongensis]